MSKFVNICGPVIGTTAYSEGVLVARDTAITLPEVTPLTADLQAMGTFSIPIWQLIENMETAITKIGADMGLRSLIKPDMKPLEFRWAQTVTDANGVTKNVGCKAFIKGIPNKIPGIGVTVGEASENECTIATTRYNLFVDGQEMWLIDRMAGIVRIAGKNYSDLDSLL
ncbi:MAG: phage major tail tube protein [Oscillospiraceae bacterium]|nr:phage major tail tube protein [Oscillospiraceae bacterium]